MAATHRRAQAWIHLVQIPDILVPCARESATSRKDRPVIVEETVAFALGSAGASVVVGRLNARKPCRVIEPHKARARPEATRISNRSSLIGFTSVLPSFDERAAIPIEIACLTVRGVRVPGFVSGYYCGEKL